jgi:hypothetical protein
MAQTLIEALLGQALAAHPSKAYQAYYAEAWQAWHVRYADPSF